MIPHIYFFSLNYTQAYCKTRSRIYTEQMDASAHRLHVTVTWSGACFLKGEKSWRFLGHGMPRKVLTFFMCLFTGVQDAALAAGCSPFNIAEQNSSHV